MEYEKTIEDKFGDEVEVYGFPERSDVYVFVGQAGDFLLTPKAARRLAKALKRAATIAEEAGE